MAKKCVAKKSLRTFAAPCIVLVTMETETEIFFFEWEFAHNFLPYGHVYLFFGLIITQKRPRNPTVYNLTQTYAR
jgi:hypothetical protein